MAYPELEDHSKCLALWIWKHSRIICDLYTAIKLEFQVERGPRNYWKRVISIFLFAANITSFSILERPKIYTEVWFRFSCWMDSLYINLMKTRWSFKLQCWCWNYAVCQNYIKQLHLFPPEKFDYFTLIYITFFPHYNADFEIPFRSGHLECTFFQ